MRNWACGKKDPAPAARRDAAEINLVDVQVNPLLSFFWSRGKCLLKLEQGDRLAARGSALDGIRNPLSAQIVIVDEWSSDGIDVFAGQQKVLETMGSRKINDAVDELVGK